MNKYIHNSIGQVFQVFLNGQGAPASTEGNLIAESTQFFTPENCYVLGLEVVQLPPKPGDSFVFNYTTKQWEDTRTNDTQWVLVREERNQKLQASDWTQLADIPSEIKSLWEPYRQALRDVTLQPDPFNITWPTPP